LITRRIFLERLNRLAAGLFLQNSRIPKKLLTSSQALDPSKLTHYVDPLPIPEVIRSIGQRSSPEHFGLPILYGEGLFATELLTNSLLTLGLPLDEPLTALVSEIFEEPTEATPLGARLGQARMLRISPRR